MWGMKERKKSSTNLRYLAFAPGKLAVTSTECETTAGAGREETPSAGFWRCKLKFQMSITLPNEDAKKRVGCESRIQRSGLDQRYRFRSQKIENI